LYNKKEGGGFYDFVTINKYLRVHTPPIALKWVDNLDNIPEGVKRPSEWGGQMAFCQILSIVRKWGHSFVVEPENESVNLLFNPQGELTSFMLEIMQHDGTLTKDQMWVSVKTQFGTVDAHIAIAKLLKYVQKKYIPNLIVKDEGEYWETESREHLVKKRAFLFGKLALVEKALKSIELDGNETSDQLVEKIERALKNLK